MRTSPSQRGGFVPSHNPRRLAGGAKAPGSFIHSLSRVRQDLRDQRVQPLHLSVPPCPLKGARHEPTESPEPRIFHPESGVR